MPLVKPAPGLLWWPADRGHPAREHERRKFRCCFQGALLHLSNLSFAIVAIRLLRRHLVEARYQVSVRRVRSFSELEVLGVG
jgi:hypothetical protein